MEIENKRNIANGGTELNATYRLQSKLKVRS